MELEQENEQKTQFWVSVFCNDLSSLVLYWFKVFSKEHFNMGYVEDQCVTVIQYFRKKIVFYLEALFLKVFSLSGFQRYFKDRLENSDMQNVKKITLTECLKAKIYPKNAKSS